MGKVFEVIKERRSIRKYKKEEVPQDKIKKVLEAANWAPSNGNSQPWKFIVMRGEYIDKICNIFYNWARDYIPKASYIPEEKKVQMIEYAKDFGGALNHIIVIYETYEDEIATEESLMASSVAIENLCLAAWEEGLGTVWIAGHVAHDEETKRILGVEDNFKIAGIIPIGYPDINPAIPPRTDPQLAEKVKWLGFKSYD